MPLRHLPIRIVDSLKIRGRTCRWPSCSRRKLRSRARRFSRARTHGSVPAARRPPASSAPNFQTVDKPYGEVTEGHHDPPSGFVSTGYAGRAGRFRPKPKPFLAFFTAVSFADSEKWKFDKVAKPLYQHAGACDGFRRLFCCAFRLFADASAPVGSFPYINRTLPGGKKTACPFVIETAKGCTERCG